MGKAVEVSHKSGGKRQRAAGALLYIVNKDVGEAQQRVAGDIVTRVSTTAELGFDTQWDNQSKPLRYRQMSQVALGKSCWWQQGYCFIFMLKKKKKVSSLIFQHNANSSENSGACWTVLWRLFCIICTKIPKLKRGFQLFTSLALALCTQSSAWQASG